METAHETVELALDVPFTIARGTTTTTETVVATIDHDGETGYGAAAPSGHYGETAATVEALLPELLAVVEAVGDPFARRRVHEEMRAVARGNPAARAAVDIALWDLAGKLLDVPVYRLLGCSPDPARCPPTSFTIGLDEPATMARRARAAAGDGHPVLKVKLGAGVDAGSTGDHRGSAAGAPDPDLEIVRSIRAVAPDVGLRVDANEAWTPSEAVRKCEALAGYDVEFVEQPVPATDREGMRRVAERSPLPIAADEACVTAADVPAIADRCDVANLKLMKTGGITPALELIDAARAHDLRVMCGCMLESDVSIAGAAHLLPLLDFADLDGSLLLADDPYDGVPVSRGRFELAAVDRGTGAGPR